MRQQVCRRQALISNYSYLLSFIKELYIQSVCTWDAMGHCSTSTVISASPLPPVSGQLNPWTICPRQLAPDLQTTSSSFFYPGAIRPGGELSDIPPPLLRYVEFYKLYPLRKVTSLPPRKENWISKTIPLQNLLKDERYQHGCPFDSFPPPRQIFLYLN